MYCSFTSYHFNNIWYICRSYNYMQSVSFCSVTIFIQWSSAPDRPFSSTDATTKPCLPKLFPANPCNPWPWPKIYPLCCPAAALKVSPASSCHLGLLCSDRWKCSSYKSWVLDRQLLVPDPKWTSQLPLKKRGKQIHIRIICGKVFQIYSYDLPSLLPDLAIQPSRSGFVACTKSGGSVYKTHRSIFIMDKKSYSTNPWNRTGPGSRISENDYN